MSVTTSFFTWNILLTLLVSGSAFGWLLFQVATMRRAGWLSAVAVPAIAAGYSVAAVIPRIPGALPSSPAILLVSLTLALAAGILFDFTTALRRGDSGLQARRKPWPLLLWGIGMLLYVTAPALGQGAGGSLALDRWAGAVMLVGVSALVGQSLSWVWRLVRNQAMPGTESQSPDAGVAHRLAGFTGGTVAALLSLWLSLPAMPGRDGLPNEPGPPRASTDPSAPGLEHATRKAAANSLLVTGMRQLGGTMEVFVLDAKTGHYQGMHVTGNGLGWSRDGARLAFTRREGDFDNLWVAAADGTAPRRLTNLPGHVRGAAWSADGQQVYFVFGKAFFGRAGIWVVPTVGGTAREILPESEGVHFVSLSQDGRTLAYFREGPVVDLVTSPGEIKLLDLSTQRARLLVRLPKNDWDITGLTWAPVGQALVVGSSERYGGPCQLMRIPIAQPQLVRLGTSFPQYLSSFTLAADGSLHLVARSKGTGGAPTKYEIWKVDLSSGNNSPLVTDGAVIPFFIQASPTSPHSF
jgi:hypothetical protein